MVRFVVLEHWFELLLSSIVYPDGRVCISILHAPGDDPMVRRTEKRSMTHRTFLQGYETSAERWSPVQSIEKILLSVVSLLAGRISKERGRGNPWRTFDSHFSEPNEASPANVDAAKMFRENREKFDDIAKRSVRKTLGL